MKIGVIQPCSIEDYRKNLETINTFIKEGVDQGVEAFFLPECFYSMSNGLKETPFLVEKGNDHYKNIQNLAIENKIYLLGGSAASFDPQANIVVNRSIQFCPDGLELGIYDKIHLFACDIAEEGTNKQTTLNESSVYTRGQSPCLVDIGEMSLGVSICFDLRFPTMYRNYYERGANCLSVSSAFTVPSGKAHWHTLLRARAIENQSFVIAAAQWGANNDRITTFGHSLVIDPWGEVLIDAGEGEKLSVVELDWKKVETVRKMILMR